MFSILLTDNQYDLYMNLCSYFPTLSYPFLLQTTCGLYFNYLRDFRILQDLCQIF